MPKRKKFNMNPLRIKQNFVTFFDKKNILIRLLIAQNARDLVISISNNFIFPLLKPMMPFLVVYFVYNLSFNNIQIVTKR